MKLFNLSLFILSLAIGTSAQVFAADASQESATYQSSFDDYKPLSDDNLSDWKSINTPSNGGGHAGHSMAGMQHKMSPQQMENMSSDNKEMPEMEGMESMDHSSMTGMPDMNQGSMKGKDHSQMKHDPTMASMEAMDHSKMDGMSHDEMKAMPSNAAPAMQRMDHAQMEKMNHGNMAAQDHSKSTMGAMDHSGGDSTSGEMQHSHDASMSDETTPPSHTSEKSHEHSEMDMPSHEPVAAIAPPNPWQIVPNLHPMIVHFPIALTLIAFLLSMAAYVRRSHPISVQFAAAAHFTLWLAALGATTAVLFGWLAYNSVNHDDAGHAAMLLHRAWAVPTAIGLVLLASWDAWKNRVNELISVPMLFLLLILSQAIVITGWLGGEVVYRHGIGVLSLPVSEGAGHSHHHDHGGADATAHTHGKTEAAPDENTEHHHDDEKGESHEH